MKNKKLHIFTILLILVMSIMTVATSILISHHDRLNYETRDEYLYIEINPVNDPNKYIFSDGKIWIYIRFAGNRNWQRFENNYSDEQYVMYTNYPKIGRSTYEEIIMDAPVFEVYIESGFVIIKMKKSLIKYDNFRIDSIQFINNAERLSEKYE